MEKTIFFKNGDGIFYAMKNDPSFKIKGLLRLVVPQRENDTNDLQVSPAQSNDRKNHVTSSRPIIVPDLVEFTGLDQWFYSSTNLSLTEEDWV